MHPDRLGIANRCRQIAIALGSAENEVDIIGNPQIAKEMARFRMSVLRLQLAAMHPDFTDEPPPEELTSAMIQNLTKSRLDLIDAIRDDLAVNKTDITDMDKRARGRRKANG